MSNFKQYVNAYIFDTNLLSTGEKIEFKPVTTGQIKRVLMHETSQDPDIMEKALDAIVNECVVSPEGFDVKKLYLQDRFWLLLEIRKATKGSKYGFQTVCASCGSQTQQNINLGSLPVVRLDTVVKPAKKKPGKIREIKEDEIPSTPVSDWDIVQLDQNVSIRLGYVTREMQEKAMDIVTSKKDLTDVQKAVELSTLLFSLAIKEVITPGGVDSELSLEDRQFLIDNVPQDSLERIGEWYEKHDFGVKFTFEVPCIHCGYKETKEIPLQSFFF